MKAILIPVTAAILALVAARGGERYEHISDEQVETPAGRFAATRWRFTDIGTGWTSDLWVAGDVVVRYDRLFTLETYEAGASGAPLLP